MRPPPMQAAALQQQHEILQQQQQQQQESLATTTNFTNHHQHQQRKSKFNQKEILAENHLNFGAANFEQSSATFASIVPTSKTYQQQHNIQQRRHHYENVEDDSIQLVDLCNTSAYSKATSQRPSSLISECTYSRSSSSEDGSSYASERFLQYQPDPAEHFIINFPAADSPTHNQNDVVIHLPLSETEPLLTNIEATHSSDTQHSICLSKNSASLIFTRKDLSQQQQQQQQKLQQQRQQPNSSSCLTTANGNNNFSIAATNKRQSVSNLGATAVKPTTAITTASGPKRRQHHSFKSAERSRKQQQHLAQQQPKYFAAQQQHHHHHHQQHRHSLQLNYNNNLISSTNLACGSNNSSHNNNFCCSSSTSSSSSYTTPVATGITAAVTRKQHAYSWYAPVYSALEEELEQDSRDSSPIHNLANTKKHHPHHHYQQHRSLQNSATSADNETVALLETRNQINIQAQLHLQSNNSNSSKIVAAATGNGHTSRRSKSAAQAPTSLPLQLTGNPNSFGDLANGAATSGSHDGEGPQAGSLGLAGGPLPRWKNFFMSLVGIRPSSNGGGAGGGRNSVSGGDTTNSISASGGGTATLSSSYIPPASPEITITRTPSEQNFVVMRDPSGRERKNSGNEKLANGSTSSLNVVQQKLWNIMRREGSAASLYNEKSHSIVQYTGLRKCETVLALTRQSSSVCSPVLGVGPGIIGGAATQHHIGGSGIFSANGVEQIRPLNRLRNSVSTMNATCSRCSSLLSLAASGSRYSLNITANGGACGFVNTAPTASASHHHHYQQQQQQQQQNSSYISSSNISSGIQNGRNRTDVTDNGGGSTAAGSMGPNVIARSNSGACGGGGGGGRSGSSRKNSTGAQSSHSASSSITPPSNMTTATLTPVTSTPTTPTRMSYDFNAAARGSLLGGFPPPIAEVAAATTSSITKQPPITLNSLLSMTPSSSSSAAASSASSSEEEAAVNVAVKSSILSASSSSKRLSSSSSSSSSSSRSTSKHQRRSQQKSKQNQEPQTSVVATTAVASTSVKPFEMFTCKLCLVDVENADEATTLLQCGCQFCTECMKAYVEFEISEGAYEISCPDAQCPAQGIITLPEIANLTTANLMKKHHRYRLNREIELDKSRTWCPRAGCETVCLVGPTANTDAAPSTSTSHSGAALSLTSPVSIKETAGNGGAGGGDTITQLLCAVQCPSCKDEFCSACKKAWHPNTTCEENSRRLVADGQDDIGIPFDNDLIKCCPMCAVPIEKDEGCAQMMCKRCKHVFCWYCLASLDDDFLLRHYDRGPCKNKLGHSRASVVWHRAQVIGIFAGFGILLLVASPLLLLAAPCIICCKCRICSGSKVDEGDGELDEATALQS